MFSNCAACPWPSRRAPRSASSPRHDREPARGHGAVPENRSTRTDGAWSTSCMTVAIRPLDVASDGDVAQYSALDEALDQHSFGGFTRYSIDPRLASIAAAECHVKYR